MFFPKLKSSVDIPIFKVIDDVIKDVVKKWY